MLQHKKPKPAISIHPSSKKLDTSSLSKKKSSFSTSGKKLPKKGQSHKRKKSTSVSVTENINGLHNLDDASTTTTATTTHSFVSEHVVESTSTMSRSSHHSAAEKNAEHKRALVEMKRLEKKRLEEERLLREKENMELQELLEKQRQEQLQHQEKTNPNDNVNGFLDVAKIKYPYVTPGQVSGLAELERRRVSEGGLELSAADEALNEQTAQRDHEVDEMLQRAKEAEANFLAQVKEQERLQRIKKVSKKCHAPTDHINTC